MNTTEFEGYLGTSEEPAIIRDVLSEEDVQCQDY